ncbi:glycosyltransferase [Carnobacterium pleistocenium]|uniref:glycosyltransferase n=1 Tax=Carnobacterium pleistocenium TaxID=181073 RepID=UPI0005526EA5|nr:glycosyltransferase [Carnobacterium pleistocenium]
MRIAYISNSIIPSQKANAVHVMKMCNALANNNNEVTLYCGVEAREEEDVFSKYGIKKSFKIYRFYQNKMMKRIIPNSLYIALMTLFRLSTKKNKEHVDYLYGRSIYGLFLLRNKYKFIYESHMPPREGILTFLEKKLLTNENCLYLVVISQALKDKYLELFPWLNSSKVIVMHDAADEVMIERNSNEFTEVLDLKDQDSEVVIGYLGHLYFGKCMEIVLKLASTRKKYDFHIVGGTEEWVSYWSRKINYLQLTNIKLYGYVDNSEIDKYYHGFDISLLPFSKNIFYDKNKKDDIGSWISPLKLFESMSHGKAIIASNLPTIQEVLTDGVDSFLVDSDNIEEWGRKLDVLVENYSIRNKFGKNAYDNFKKKYTWDIRAKKIIKLFKDEVSQIE